MKKNIAKLLLIVTLCLTIFQTLSVTNVPTIQQETIILCSDFDDYQSLLI